MVLSKTKGRNKEGRVNNTYPQVSSKGGGAPLGAPPLTVLLGKTSYPIELQLHALSDKLQEQRWRQAQ